MIQSTQGRGHFIQNSLVKLAGKNTLQSFSQNQSFKKSIYDIVAIFL